MAKHTPGPWLISGDSLISGSNERVASVHYTSGDDAGTAEGNARLMHAAPELLSELRLWVDSTNGYQLEARAKAGQELTSLEWETLNRRFTAREIIAKATGENSWRAQNE
jgi:hypothetical protein